MTTPALVPPAGELAADELARYSRQLILGELGLDGQRRLRAARVLVIGAGGLGSPVLLYLAAAGVGTIGIVDSDVVETSNLHRQVIHPTASVGRPKVDSAAEAIAALNPGVLVVRHHLRLGPDTLPALLADYDVVVDGSDNFPTRYLVNDGCVAAGKPLVWGSVMGFAAQVAVFWAGAPDGVELRDVFPEPPAAGQVPSCAEAGVVGAVCAQAGSVMAMETIKLICGIGRPLLGRVLVIDALAGRWDEVPVRPGVATAGAQSSTPRRQQAGEVHEQAVAPGSGDEPGAARDADDSRDADAFGVDGAGAESAVGESGRRSRTGSQPATPTNHGGPAGTDELVLPGADHFLLLDVRSPAEFAEQSIPGSRNVPLPDLLDGAVVPPTDRPILVICRSGARAAIAAASLRARGRHDVQVLSGGLDALSDPATASGRDPAPASERD